MLFLFLLAPYPSYLIISHKLVRNSLRCYIIRSGVRMKNKVISLLLLIAVFLSFGMLQSAPEQRIVAIGDIHGAFDSFTAILQKAGLTDPKNNWIGKNTIFVQTGDVLDRGPQSRKAMDLLIQFEKQASGKGSQVIALLGNHEVMNLIGDLRYVSEEEYTSYSSQNSEERREKALKEFEKYLTGRAEAKKLQASPFTPEMRLAWKQKHPVGYIEHREAFGPKGKYGRWIRRHKAVGEAKQILFLHGGISPTVSDLSIKALNDRVKNEIQMFDQYQKYMIDRKLILPFFDLDEMLTAAKEEIESLPKNGDSNDRKILEEFLNIGNWLIMHPEGPLWFRGYAEWTDEQGKAEIPKILEKYQAKNFVVAHTVQRDGSIGPRFHQKVFLIDTGMLGGSFFPGGRPSALEFRGKGVTAIYLDHQDSL